jgi:hypothetical protein
MRVHRSIPLRLEVMEEKVLLSSGTGDPAAAVQIEAQKALKPFIFNGKLPLKVTETFDQAIGASTYTEVTPRLPREEAIRTDGREDQGVGNARAPGIEFVQWAARPERFDV